MTARKPKKPPDPLSLFTHFFYCLHLDHARALSCRLICNYAQIWAFGQRERKSFGFHCRPFRSTVELAAVRVLNPLPECRVASPPQTAARPFPATVLRYGGRLVAFLVMTPAPCLSRFEVPDLRCVTAGARLVHSLIQV